MPIACEMGLVTIFLNVSENNQLKITVCNVYKKHAMSDLM